MVFGIVMFDSAVRLDLVNSVVYISLVFVMCGVIWLWFVGD